MSEQGICLLSECEQLELPYTWDPMTPKEFARLLCVLEARGCGNMRKERLYKEYLRVLARLEAKEDHE